MRFLIKSEPVKNVQITIGDYFKVRTESVEYEIPESIENTIKMMKIIDTCGYEVELIATIDEDLQKCFNVCLYKKSNFGEIMLVFRTMTQEPFTGLGYCLDYLVNSRDNRAWHIIRDFIIKIGEKHDCL